MTFHATLERVYYPWAATWLVGAMTWLVFVIAFSSNYPMPRATKTACVYSGAGFLLTNATVMLTLITHMLYREISTKQKKIGIV